MQFNEASNYTGLIQDVEQRLWGDHGYGQISGNTARLKRFTGLLNRGIDRYTSVALQNDGRWQFDDTNFTDYPEGVTNIVANRKSYPLASEHLVILSVERLNEAGDDWQEMVEIDEQDFLNRGVSLTEFMSNATGIPLYYNKTGSKIELYPTPSYSEAGGLKVRFQRAGDYFVYTDTTKEPGFASLHHPFVSLYASWQGAIGTDKEVSLRNEVQRWEEVEIPTFYSTRSRDLPLIIRPRNDSWRAR